MLSQTKFVDFILKSGLGKLEISAPKFWEKCHVTLLKTPPHPHVSFVDTFSNPSPLECHVLFEWLSDFQKTFLSEGCSLRRQITFPKVSTLARNSEESRKDNPEDEMIIGFLKDLGNNATYLILFVHHNLPFWLYLA